jgi:hypothetical protein
MIRKIKLADNIFIKIYLLIYPEILPGYRYPADH